MPNTRKKRANPQRLPGPTAGRPPLHLNAAGIDVGSAKPYVAVPPDRSTAPTARGCKHSTPSGRSTALSVPPMTSVCDGPPCASAIPSSAPRPPAASTGQRG